VKNLIALYEIRLGKLPGNTKVKILLGRIQWLFILNVSRELSGFSGKSTETASEPTT
jgi:hypothetical protein